MSRATVYEQELKKLTEIFKDVEPAQAQLVQGLIEDAAFLRAENAELKELIKATGMVRIHPTHPERQKPTETARQYLKNVNSYAVVIKALNGILQKSNVEEDEDELEDYE